MKRGRVKRGLLVVLLAALTTPGYVGHVKAFQGAQGYGANAHGGTGGATCYVTSLADSGTGSLRACLAITGPRIVKTNSVTPRGWVTLQSPLSVPSFTTLDLDHIGIRVAQSGWPGGPAVWVNGAQHVVIRDVRVRPGPVPTAQSAGADALRIQNSSQVILDHASLSWALDENLEITASTDVTIQLSIIAEGLDCAGHYEGCHSRGLLVRTTSQRITLWRNLFAHNDYRNPELANTGYVDIRGVVAYDWKRKHMSLNDMNFGDFFNLRDTWFPPGPESQAYVAPPEQPFTAPAVPVTTNLDDILLEAGCRTRDVTDARIVADVQNGTGGLIDNPAEVGGWPAL